MNDVTVVNNGSIVAFYLHTDLARDWVGDNVQSEGYQWLGGGLMVEPRYAVDLVHAMVGSGLNVR